MQRHSIFLAIAFIAMSLSTSLTNAQPPSALMPDMSDFFDFDAPASSDPTIVVTDHDIDPHERPPNRSVTLSEHPPVAMQATASELKELSDWVRWLTLRNLPPNYEDNRKWGKEKQVIDGWHVSMDGLRLDTKRKWKSVRHGTWSRYYIEFVDPENQFEIEVTRLEFSPNGHQFTTQTRIVAPLKLFARVSQWQRNAQLYSISIAADAKVELILTCETQIRLNPLVLPPDVELHPKVMDATIRILSFDTHEISRVHGAMAEWLGRGIRKVLDHKITDYNDKLVEKINQTLAKQQDKLKFSGQDWLRTAFSKSNKQ